MRHSLEAAALATFAALAAPLSAQLPLDGPMTVNASTENSQTVPRIAADGVDNFQIVWQTKIDASTHDVRRRRLGANGAFGTDSLLSASSTGNQYQPVIAMNGSSDWLAGWLSDHETEGDVEVFGRTTSEDGTILGAEFQLNNEDGVDVPASAIAVARSWYDQSFSIYRRSNGSEHTAHSGDWNQLDGLIGFEELGPSTNTGSSGIAAVDTYTAIGVWTGVDASGTAVLFNCVDAVGPLWFGVRLHDAEAGNQTFPDVASDGEGRIVAVWQDGHEIVARLLRFTGTSCTFHGNEFPIESVDGALALYPKVDMATDGAFVVTWATTDPDTDGGIALREFTKSGQPVGNQFPAHDLIDGSQTNPDVAISATQFVAVWQTLDEGEEAVFDAVARRYTRRVVFTDDFEILGGFDDWSDVVGE